MARIWLVGVGFLAVTAASQRVAVAAPDAGPEATQDWRARQAQAMGARRPPQREHATVEASLGIGGAAIDVAPQAGLAAAVGVGVFVGPRAAVGLRLAGTLVTWRDDAAVPPRGRVYQFAGWLGPSLQFFVVPTTFVGGGIGATVSTNRGTTDRTEFALGADLRAGVVLYESADSAVTLAIEVTGVLPATGAVLLGYQHL